MTVSRHQAQRHGGQNEGEPDKRREVEFVSRTLRHEMTSVVRGFPEKNEMLKSRRTICQQTEFVRWNLSATFPTLW